MERDRKLPDPVQKVYGQDMYEKGYGAGYNQCSWDVRRRRMLREKSLRNKFNKVADWIEDCLASNRRH